MWSKKPFFQRIFFTFPYANLLPTGIQKDEQSHYYNVHTLYTKYMQVYYDLMIDEYKQTYLNMWRFCQSNFAKLSRDIFRPPLQDCCNP